MRMKLSLFQGKKINGKMNVKIEDAMRMTA